MRQNQFYIYKLRMVFSNEKIPTFESWIKEHNVFKEVNEKLYSVDLEYSKDMNYYEDKISSLNDFEKVQVYKDILQNIYNKQNTLSSMGQEIKLNYPNNKLTKEQDKRLMKNAAAFSNVWFEKEIKDYLPKIGLELNNDSLSMEDLLSSELALRPYMYQMCQDLILEQKEELKSFGVYNTLIQGLEILMPNLANNKGINNFQTVYRISRSIDCINLVKKEHINIENGYPLICEDKNNWTRLRPTTMDLVVKKLKI